jgi:hypothetical protein
MTTLAEPPLDQYVGYMKSRFGLDTLIETGTYLGDSTAWAAARFSRVVTIDTRPDFQQRAAEGLCAGYGNIEFWSGDTRQLLAAALATLDGPALLWLDAHAAPDLFGERDDWPILEELAAVNASPHRHFILIDDAPCFYAGTPFPACPALAEVVLVAAEGGYAVIARRDVIVLVPAEHAEEFAFMRDD